MISERTKGFSLVEVNLAILLVSFGMLTLFMLFPLGLRESEMGLMDTHEAQFADAVLSALEGNAMRMTNWLDWKEIGTFKKKIIHLQQQGDYQPYTIYPMYKHGWDQQGIGKEENGGGAVPYPDPGETHVPEEYAKSYIRYYIEIEDINSDPARKSVHLQVKSGIYGNFTTWAQDYYTELVYTGM